MTKHTDRNRLVKKPKKLIKLCKYKIGREHQMIALKALTRRMYSKDILQHEWPMDAFRVCCHIFLENPDMITDRMLLEYKIAMKKELGE